MILCVENFIIFVCVEVCVIFLTHSFRLHDFFLRRLRNFFVERLRDFFCGEVGCFFLWRGCMIFFLLLRFCDFVC